MATDRFMESIKKRIEERRKYFKRIRASSNYSFKKPVQVCRVQRREIFQPIKRGHSKLIDRKLTREESEMINCRAITNKHGLKLGK